MKKILLSLLMLCCMTAAWAQEDGFVDVATTIQLWNAIKDNPRAKVRLTADFALSDINKDYELYCNGNTFCGTIDGNGHTIKGDPKASVRARTYMFYNCSGATFKNLTFKGIRVNSDDNPNQAIITATAKNGCVFENITFENVHTWTNYDNAGSAAGWAENCTFTNITVRNSDFTTDDDQAGCVVGHAIGCTFTNITVENCESTSGADFQRGDKSGGVAGRTDGGTITNVEILGCFIKTYAFYGGGVVGYSENTQFTNCVVDDQSCVCVDGAGLTAFAGGIVGHGTKCNISNCINSALIAAEGQYAGGIVGCNTSSNIVGCLNTGMVIAITMDDVKNGFYNKYKTKTGMTCVSKTYQGKEYVIRKYNGSIKGLNSFGGIAGKMGGGNVSKCVNFGSVYSYAKKTGGIAGYLTGGKISNCLSDFLGSKGIYGICQFETVTSTTSGGNGKDPGNSSTTIAEVSIVNCLNKTTYKDVDAYDDKWNGFSGSNNYSLTTSTDANLTKYITKTTAAKLKSGEICHLLGANWEQNLGTDAYPTPTGNKGLYHTREVSNEFGTVCLPFALESNEDITYYTFNPDVKTDDSNVVLKFEKTDYVDAGKPVLFRASKTGELTFRNADSSFSGSPYYSMSEYFAWYIAGTYEQQVFSESTSPSSDIVYYVSDGKIRNAKTVTIAPYRAWFGGPSIYELKAAGAKAISVVLEDEDGETTAISLINENYNENENFGGKAFSLLGTEVGEGYRGIVIRNGKKYINR